MDVEEDDWDRLQKLAASRDKWKAKVNKLKTEARRKTKPERKKDTMWAEPIPEHLMPTPSPQQRPTRNTKK